MEMHAVKVIARIQSDFPEKFGIPRQSGLVPALRAGIPIPEAQKSFEPETANQKPFSWGSKGAILFCEREWPLCPRRPQAAYPLALVRRKGAFSHVRE